MTSVASRTSGYIIIYYEIKFEVWPKQKAFRLCYRKQKYYFRHNN